MIDRKKALDPVQLSGHRIDFAIPGGVRSIVDMERKEGQGFQVLRLLSSIPVSPPVAFPREPKTGGAENELRRDQSRSPRAITFR